MKQLILVLTLFIGCSFGQQRDTVYQQLFDGPITTAPETSNVFYAIGQTQHKVSIQLTTKAGGGGACTGGFVDIALEGSSFGTVGTYVTIGNPISNISVNQYGQLVATVIANVAMPYVRLVVTSFDTTNCSLTAFYSGTISPTDDPIPPTLTPLDILAITETRVVGTFTNIIDTSQYDTHRVTLDLTDCTPIVDLWNFDLQFYYAWDSDGPWTQISWMAEASNVLHLDLRPPYFKGKFPLLRGTYVETNAAATDCGFGIYYWGTNEGYVNTSEAIQAALFTRDPVVVPSGSGSTGLVAAAAAGIEQCLVQLTMVNSCPTGQFSITSDVGGIFQIAAVGPGEVLEINDQETPIRCVDATNGGGFFLFWDTMPVADCTSGANSRGSYVRLKYKRRVDLAGFPH